MSEFTSDHTKCCSNCGRMSSTPSHKTCGVCGGSMREVNHGEKYCSTHERVFSPDHHYCKFCEKKTKLDTFEVKDFVHRIT